MCPVNNQFTYWKSKFGPRSSVLYQKGVKSNTSGHQWPLLRRTPELFLFAPLQNTIATVVVGNNIFRETLLARLKDDKGEMKVLFSLCRTSWAPPTGRKPTPMSLHQFKKETSFLFLLYSLSKCRLTRSINKCLMNNKMAAVNSYTHYSVVFKRQTSTFLLNPESTYTIVGHKHSSKAINTIHRFLANYPSR